MRASTQSAEPQLDTVLAALSLAVLLAFTWAIALMPHAQLGVVGLTLALALCVLVALLAVAAIHRLRAIVLPAWSHFWPVLAAVTVGSGTLLISAIGANGMPWWVMREDMVWNAAQSLLINADGGVLATEHPNPAPLTNALFAVAYGVDPSLGAVLRGHTAVVLVLVTLLSLIAGSYAARRARRLRPLVRVCVVATVALLPYSGIALGAAMHLGHVNVLSTMLVLWSAWVMYADGHVPGWIRLSLLAGAATALLASWAPLAAVPVVLALLLILVSREGFREIRLSRGWPLTVQMVAAAQLLAYGVAVTIPDLRRSGTALVADGGVGTLTLPLAGIFFLGFLLFGISAMQTSARDTDLWRAGLGLVGITLSAGPVLIYLMGQRWNVDQLWGYYPAKFASLVIGLLVGVSTAIVAALVRAQWVAARQLVAAAGALPVILLVISTTAVGPGLGAYMPGITAAFQPGPAGFQQSVDELIAIDDADLPGVSVMVQWAGANEAQMNHFLIQLSATGGDDPIRIFAYTLDTSNPAQFCELVTVADRPVAVFTRLDIDAFDQQYLAECAAASLVDVRTTLP